MRNGRSFSRWAHKPGVDGDIFESETGLLYISTRDGKIHIFHEDSPDKLTEVETVTTEFWRQNDGVSIQDAQPFSDHRRVLVGSSCSNEGESRGGAKRFRNVSGPDLWAVENHPVARGNLRGPFSLRISKKIQLQRC